MALTFSESAAADHPLNDPASDLLGRAAFAERIARELCARKTRDPLVVSLTGGCGSGKSTLKNFVRHMLPALGTPENPAAACINFTWCESGDDEHLVSDFFDQVAEQLCAPGAAGALRDLGETWKRLGATVARDATSPHSRIATREARDTLRAQLNALSFPLVIFLDDIDRLPAERIRALMRLLKAHASLPNVVCFLVFEKTAVVDALAGSAPDSGAEALRRIVHVELEMPEPPEPLLRRQLETGFEDLLGPVTFPPRPRERWSDAFSGAVWPLVSTPRDVQRLLAACTFQLGHFFHPQSGVLEVNAIDLVLLETLRMFAPSAYSELRDTFRRRETRLVRFISGREEERKEVRLEIDRSVEEMVASGRKRRAVAAALQQLVPLATGGSQGGREDWDRDLRFCSPRHMERYFHVGAIADAVPARRLVEIARAADDRQKMETLLLTAAEEKVLPEVLERLPALLQGLPESHVTIASVALCGLCDRLPTHAPDDAEARLIKLASELFAQLKNPLTRENTIGALLDDPSRLTGPILLLQALRPRSDLTNGAASAALSIEQFRRLIRPAVTRLHESATSGAIWRSREAGTLIKRWWEWAGSKEEVQRWLLGAVKDPECARAWLRAFLSPSPTTPGKEVVLQLEDLRQYCDPTPVAIAAIQANGDSIDRAAARKLGQVLATKGSSAGIALRTVNVAIETEAG